MKKILLLLVIGSFLIASCVNENYVKSQIQKANYCETKEDCVLVGSKCPFDCYIYSNAKEAGRIQKLVDGYESNCMYSCIACSDVECFENKCKPVCQ